MPSDEDFEVWQENMEAANLFLRMTTQWLVTAYGGYVGFNYPSLTMLFDLFEVKDRISVFGDLQVMEFAALATLNAKAGD